MDKQEVLDNLAIAQAQIEWEYSMNIAAKEIFSIADAVCM